MKGHPQIQGQQAGALLLEVLIAILIFFRSALPA